MVRTYYDLYRKAESENQNSASFKLLIWSALHADIKPSTRLLELHYPLFIIVCNFWCTFCVQVFSRILDLKSLLWSYQAGATYLQYIRSTITILVALCCNWLVHVVWKPLILTWTQLEVMTETAATVLQHFLWHNAIVDLRHRMYHI